MDTAPEDLAAENRVLRERVAQLESALASHSDPILRALVENAPAYLNVITPEGRFMATGRQSDAFGSVIGRSVYEFCDPSSHATLRSAFERAVATRQPVVYECRGYGENGEPDHTYLVRAIPLLEGERVSALMLVPTDITDRARLERSLMQSEQTLRLAVSSSRMGLWRWDVVEDRIEWDARTREIFGVSETPSLYATYRELVHPDDRAVVERVIANALETGAYPTFEHRLATAPGQPERWIMAAASATRDADGKITQLMGGVLDISEQKRLQAQVLRAERVESIGQLTAGIAHNFNNLLAAIVPNIEIVLAAAPERERQGLSAALDASLQARDLVRSLLALAGRRGARPEPICDVTETVQRVESICRMTFPREIALHVEIAADVGRVAMPATDLEQVLLNLLFNARDALASASGSTRRIEVLVDGAPGPALGRMLRFRVIDTGVGMSEAVQRRIFEPFFTTKPPHQGSGLGLSNALARVREAHGRLECESAPTAGTTFTLLLPEAAAPEVERRPPSSAPARARGETILVIDDEVLVREVVRRLLVGQGYEVLEAGCAEDARAVLDRAGSRVRLIILDHSMPKESGLEALPSLQARCSAPVVLFTGVSPAVPSGIAAVLQKPARPSELLRLVRDALERTCSDTAAG